MIAILQVNASNIKKIDDVFVIIDLAQFRTFKCANIAGHETK
jgi:hypothetical protein